MNSSLPTETSDPWLELAGLCDPLVLQPPKTWGDPERSAQMGMPQGLGDVVHYLKKHVVNRPWRNHLVLLTAVLYSQNVQYKTVSNRLSGLHRGFGDLFAVLDLQSMSQWEVDKHLSLYLSAQILPKDTPIQRISFWKSYQSGSYHLKRWLRSLPAKEQEQYRPFVLPSSDDPHELTRLSGDRQRRYEQQEKRKAETDAIMPMYADLRTQAHLRYNLLVRLRKAYHKAVKAVEQEKRSLPFEFEMREGRSGQERNGPTERLVFKLWDRRAFVRDHPDFLQARTPKRHVRNHTGPYSDEKNSYLLEFVRVESLDGTNPVGLWFLELLEHNVLGSGPVSGSSQKIAEKQTWLREQGYGEDDHEEELLSPFSTKTSGILIPSLASGNSLYMSYARERMGTIFVPIESFWVAATFGMVALHILTANGMRIGELQQLRASPGGIVPITLPPAPDAVDQTPRLHWAVCAVPKGRRVSATYYLDDEHLRLLALIKLMLCEHYCLDPRSGEDLPLVSLRDNKHRFQPDRYLFQYNHLTLTQDDLRACIRFLIHGLVFQTLDERRITIRPHLLRHGFATWALNVAKEPVDIVAKILNQNNVEITKYYGRPNPRLIAERSHGLMYQISSYIDVGELILRSPEELRELIKKAQITHGTLARVRGGRCLLSGECPIFFACIGCSAKAPDPAQRGELEEVKQETLIHIERAKKKGLSLEVIQYQKKLQQCRVELKEMDMIEACREDENREPEVNFEIHE